MKQSLRFLQLAVLFGSTFLQAHAASDSWNVDAAGNWSANGSWLSATQTPGSTTIDNTDVATFSKTLTAARVVTVDNPRYIGGISFGNTSTFGYTLATGVLNLNSGGVIQNLAANGNHTDTVSSAIKISGTSAATAAITAGATSATSLLSIGAITGSATSGNTSTLTLNGTNTGSNTITGIVGDGAGTGNLALTKAGTGLWTLSGANTYTGVTTISGGILQFAKTASLYNNTPLSWTPANIVVGSGGTVALNVGGTGEFTTGNVTTLLTNLTTINSNGLQAGSAIAFNTANASGGLFTIADNIADSTGTGAGSVGLKKLGANTLALSGTNTYSGATTIASGTLQFTKAAALYNNTPASWTAANLTVASGAMAAFNVGGTNEFTSGNVTTLLGNLTGSISSNGLLAGSTLGLDTTNATGGTFTVGSAITNSTGTGSGSLGLTKLGANILVLTGANTYTGNTTINAGTLSLSGGNNRLPSAGTVILAGASTIDVGSTTQSLTNITFPATATDAITGSGTLNVTGATAVSVGDTGLTTTLNLSGGGTTTFTPTLYIGHSVVNSGIYLATGTVTVAAGTTLNGSTVDLGYSSYSSGANAPNSAGTLTVNGNVKATTLTLVDLTTSGHSFSVGSATVNLNTGATLSATTIQPGASGSGTITRTFNFNGGTISNISTGNLTIGAFGGTTASFVLGATGTPTFDISSGRTGTVSQALSGSGSLTKTSAGQLILAGANTYSGVTMVNGGTLQFAKEASFYNNTHANWTPANLIVASGSTAAFNVGGTNEFTTADMTTLFANLSTGISSNGLQAGTAIGFDTTNATGGTFTVADNIADSTGTGAGSLGVTKLGTNTLVLSGTNTYTGTTTLAAGNLNVGSPGALGTTSTLFFAGGTLQYSAANTTDYTPRFSTAANQPYSVDTNGQSVNWATALTSAGSTLTKSGTGTLTLTAANTYSGATNVNGGTLALSGGNNRLLSTGTVNFGGNGTFDVGTTSQTVANLTSGVGSFTEAINGSGSITVTGTASPFYVANGTNGTTQTSTLGITGTTVTFPAASTFYVANQTGSNNATSTGTLNLNSGATLNTGTLVVAYMNYTGGAGSALAGGTININSGATLSAKTLTMQSANHQNGLHNAAITLNSGGTLLLGTLSPGPSYATTTNSIALSGTIKNYDASTNLVINALVGATHSFTLGTGTPAIEIGSGRTGTVSEPMSGTGSLDKNGTGALTLPVASTYSGGTTVNSGKLLANNTTGSATGTGTVTVKNSATFGGTGAVSGAVSVESGGTLSPGSTGIESLATGSLTLATGSSLAAEINSAAGTADLINAFGDVSLGGTLSVSDIAGTQTALFTGTKLALINYSGTLTGTFTGLAEGSTFTVGPNTFMIRYNDGNSVTLEVQATGYTAWANAQGLDNSNNDPSQDPDHDGLSNLLEFYLGGNPLAGSTAELPVTTSDATYLILTFHRDDTASAAMTAQVAEYGSDLSGWTDVPLGTTAGTTTNGNGVIVTVADNGSAPDLVTVKVPKVLASSGKLFVRLKITQP